MLAFDLFQNEEIETRETLEPDETSSSPHEEYSTKPDNAFSDDYNSNYEQETVNQDLSTTITYQDNTSLFKAGNAPNRKSNINRLILFKFTVLLYLTQSTSINI